MVVSPRLVVQLVIDSPRPGFLVSQLGDFAAREPPPEGGIGPSCLGCGQHWEQLSLRHRVFCSRSRRLLVLARACRGRAWWLQRYWACCCALRGRLQDFALGAVRCAASLSLDCRRWICRIDRRLGAPSRSRSSREPLLGRGAQRRLLQQQHQLQRQRRRQHQQQLQRSWRPKTSARSTSTRSARSTRTRTSASKCRCNCLTPGHDVDHACSNSWRSEILPQKIARIAKADSRRRRKDRKIVAKWRRTRANVRLNCARS